MFAAGKTSTSAAAKLYVDDVFSTYLYTGNGITNIINNGVALDNTASWSVSKLSDGTTESVAVVKTDTGNNVYVGSNNVSSPAARIMKLDSAGAIQWQRGLATGWGVVGIAVDSSSNVYIASGLSVAYFAKYNSSGVIQWQRQLTLAGSSRAQGVATDSSSNVYVGGYVYDNVSTTYGFIAKYNTSGTLQWQRFLVQNGIGEITKVATDSSSNIYVTGYVYDGTGTSYLILAKYNTSGTLQWQRKLQPSGAGSNGWDLVTDSSANVYVTGTGSNQTTIAKYNTSGVLQWQRKLSLTSTSVYGFGITVDSSGNVYGSGYFSFGSPLTYYAFVVKYNTSGVLQWQRMLRSGGAVVSNGITVDGSTNLYVAGSATNSGASATFVAKLLQDGSTTSGAANDVVMSSGILIDAAGTWVDSAGGATSSTGTATDSASTLTESALTNTYTLASQAAVVGTGGMVWLKSRSGATDHALYDTVRGATLDLTTTSTAASTTQATGLTSFGASGFSLGALAKLNTNAASYVSWAFREAPKFFDVQTKSHTNGTASTIDLSTLGTVGMVVVKNTGSTSNWLVWHRSVTAGNLLYLNSLVTQTADTTLSVSGTTATISSAVATGTYVVYAWAHNAGGFGLTGTENVISCGSFYSVQSGSNVPVNLSFEPQFVLFKNIDTNDNWRLYDSMRGMQLNPGNAQLGPDTSSVEFLTSSQQCYVTSSGFVWAASTGLGYTGNHIYIAIRRPNKPPTTGTQVFQPTVYTGTNVNNRLVDTTIAPDMVFVRQRNDATLAGMVVGDRLRGQPYLLTGGTAAEVTSATALDQQLVSATEYGTAFSAMNGFWVGTDATAKLNVNTTASNHIAEAFKRAPGVFDEVCYTGTGSANTQAHNLGVAPELMIVKTRSAATNWFVYVGSLGATKYLNLNQTSVPATATSAWNDTAPTASVFTVGTSGTNSTAASYVAYLFATLAGISKVFSYTGNGSSQTINCGFSTGARFVLIKRTDSTGDWYVWDSARGIVAGDDPHLSLNTTAAEVTTDDSVDTDSTGFIVNQLAATNVNVTSATYIGLAFS